MFWKILSALLISVLLLGCASAPFNELVEEAKATDVRQILFCSCGTPTVIVHGNNVTVYDPEANSDHLNQFVFAACSDDAQGLPGVDVYRFEDATKKKCPVEI